MPSVLHVAYLTLTLITSLLRQCMCMMVVWVCCRSLMTDIGGIVADGELYSASLLLGVLAVVGFIVLLLVIGFFIWHKYVVPNILYITCCL